MEAMVQNLNKRLEALEAEPPAEAAEPPAEAAEPEAKAEDAVP